MNLSENPPVNTLRKIGGVAVIALVGLVSIPFLFGMGSMHDRGDWPSQFQNNGEQIYFTATSASGLPINARGGNMHMGLVAGGCVTCHGADRQGGRLVPSFWKSAPPLTPDALFADHSEDSHGDHDGYSEEALRRAITQGIEPGGEHLGQEMPRWSMSEQDLDDLIAFLVTSDDRH
jgi:cytochrome c oxidase subunit II